MPKAYIREAARSVAEKRYKQLSVRLERCPLLLSPYKGFAQILLFNQNHGFGFGLYGRK